MRSNTNAGEWSGTPSALDSSSFVTVGSIVCVPPTIDDPVAVLEELVERLLLEIGAVEPGYERLADVERLDRHRLAIGQPKTLDDDDRLGRRDVQEPTQVRAGWVRRGGRACGSPGIIPRRRMSSVNDVIVSSCAIFGSLTNVPLPRLRTR